ncbi:hypothetical protein AS188_04155 [Kocuria flava]|uniref:VOC domain-containing protein n=2 Tax=Kocuria flava TaxID=446860 RepID=A0A0U3H847_9MICC|nr:VOC family protein [Kocuria flava]ALU39077.1 hypothetical protein AS188_04155 [Kocuria flava]
MEALTSPIPEEPVMAYTFIPHIPVADLERSRTFYEALGWRVRPGMEEGHSIVLDLGEDFGVTLVERSYMQQMVGEGQELADPTRSLCGSYALVVETPEEVDELADRAAALGAPEIRGEDAGYMRYRIFADPDGHRWDVAWVDPLAMDRDWEAVRAKYPDAAIPQG